MLLLLLPVVKLQLDSDGIPFRLLVGVSQLLNRVAVPRVMVCLVDNK